MTIKLVALALLCLMTGTATAALADCHRPGMTAFGTKLTVCSVLLFAAGSQGNLGRF